MSILYVNKIGDNKIIRVSQNKNSAGEMFFQFDQNLHHFGSFGDHFGVIDES